MKKKRGKGKFLPYRETERERKKRQLILINFLF